MRAFLRITLPLLLFASGLSGIAGYAYGVHSSGHIVVESRQTRSAGAGMPSIAELHAKARMQELPVLTLKEPY
jgi:hypothetical protein